MSIYGNNSAQKSIPLIIEFQREIFNCKEIKNRKNFFSDWDILLRLRLNDFLMLGACDGNSKIIQFTKNNSVIFWWKEERIMPMKRKSENKQPN